jgi:Transmembrane amino acid transporter protein
VFLTDYNKELFYQKIIIFCNFILKQLIGLHDCRSLCKRAAARLPVVVPIWFLAIIFPFFGPINSAVGSLLVSFTVYIIPSLAHMVTFRSAQAREVNFFFTFYWFYLFILFIYYLHAYIISIINNVLGCFCFPRLPDLIWQESWFCLCRIVI